MWFGLKPGRRAPQEGVAEHGRGKSGPPHLPLQQARHSRGGVSAFQRPIGFYDGVESGLAAEFAYGGVQPVDECLVGIFAQSQAGGHGMPSEFQDYARVAFGDQIEDVAQMYVGNRAPRAAQLVRSEEHTSELQSLIRISYAVFCL